jgi:predicted amidohydrolase
MNGMDRTILRGGHVVDPASRAAGVGDVMVQGDRVAAVSAVPILDGEATIVDVTGLVVGPGFVDLHSHVHSIAGQRLQAFDGVTTNLDLEMGLMPIEQAYAAAAADGRVLNYGYSASWTMARGAVLAGVEPSPDFHAGAALLGNAD